MLTRNQLLHLFGFDIETVSEYPTYDELLQNEPVKGMLWKKKSAKYNDYKEYRHIEDENERYAILYQDKAGLHAEFSRIVTISGGMVTKLDDEGVSIIVKSYTKDSEKELLQSFADALNKTHDKFGSALNLFGFNIKGFDIPVVGRRMLANGVEIPQIMDASFKKPWELKAVDLLDIWKQGSTDLVSLDLVCYMLGIKSPKTIMDNNEVGARYWVSKDIDTIEEYCREDTKVTLQAALKISGFPIE
jgi:3'-5' exonuclease